MLKRRPLSALNASYKMLPIGAIYDNCPVETGPGQHKKIQQEPTVEIGLLEPVSVNYERRSNQRITNMSNEITSTLSRRLNYQYNYSLLSLWGVFGVDGIAVFVYLDVGYSVISLKFRGIPVLENSAVNGFSYIEALYSVLPEKFWNFLMNLMCFI